MARMMPMTNIGPVASQSRLGIRPRFHQTISSKTAGREQATVLLSTASAKSAIESTAGIGSFDASEPSSGVNDHFTYASIDPKKNAPASTFFRSLIHATDSVW